jgi:hypothetical protein
MSTLDVLGSGGAWIEGGKLKRGAMAHTRFRATVDGARYTFVAAPLADALAAHRSTGIPEVVAGVPVPSLAAPILQLMAPLIHRLLRQPRVRQFIERRGRKTAPPSTESRSSPQHRSFVWAQASGLHGTSTTVLSLGEGYGFAAAAIVRASELLSSFDGVGTWTPGAAFGPDFVMALDGVRRQDLAVDQVTQALADRGTEPLSRHFLFGGSNEKQS